MPFETGAALRRLRSTSGCLTWLSANISVVCPKQSNHQKSIGPKNVFFSPCTRPLKKTPCIQDKKTVTDVQLCVRVWVWQRLARIYFGSKIKDANKTANYSEQHFEHVCGFGCLARIYFIENIIQTNIISKHAPLINKIMPIQTHKLGILKLVRHHGKANGI